jgi:hypothetical protein
MALKVNKASLNKASLETLLKKALHKALLKVSLKL